MSLLTPTKEGLAGALTIVREPGPQELNPERFVRRRRAITQALAWGMPVLLIDLWQIAATTRWIDTRFFPAPSTVWNAGQRAFRNGVMTQAAIATIEKLLIGYGLGALAGVALGLLLGISWILRASLEHTLVALYTLPKLALFPAFLLIFGIGWTPQIVLVAVTVFFVVVLATTTAVISVEEGYRDAATAFGANRRQLLRHVIIPAAMPAIATAIRLTAGIAILVIVGIEMVSGNSGLGYLIYQRSQVFDPATMYAGVIVAGVIGVAFTGIVTALMRFAIPQQRPKCRRG